MILNDLVPAEGVQRDLFIDGHKQSEQVMAVLDEINQRFGRHTLKIASEGFKAPWKMKQNFKSPDYTCDWDGVIKVYK